MLNTNLKISPQTDITLAKFKLWSITGDRRGDVISCMNGRLWITQEGDLKDYILEQGQNFWVTRRGNVIVQALHDSQFKYSLNELDSRIETNTQPFRHSHRTRVSNHLR